jgi:tryptophanyl-tRNA synthetase
MIGQQESIISALTSRTSALVDPWNVQGAIVDGKQLGIDYDRLIESFGTRKIDEAVLTRLETLTGRKPHVLLRRGIFFSHR